MDLKAKIDNIEFKKLTPRALFCELTFRCNLNCIHCFCNGYNPEGEKELTFEEWRDCIDQAIERGVAWVTFSGGEPFLHPRIFDLMLYARQAGLSVILKTNATLIGRDEVRRLKELYVRDIAVSLYAMNPEIHDRVTGVSGSFEKTMQAVKLLREENFAVYLTPVALKGINVSEILPMYEFARKNRCSFSVGIDLLPNYAGLDDIVEKLQISAEDIKMIVEETSKDRNFVASEARYPCGVSDPNGPIHINPYGYVFPCLTMQVERIIDKNDNVRIRRLSEIPAKSTFYKLLPGLTWDSFPECKECRYRIYCHRCFIAEYIRTGSFYGSPSYANCATARFAYEIMQERRDVNAKKQMENACNRN